MDSGSLGKKWWNYIADGIDIAIQEKLWLFWQSSTGLYILSDSLFHEIFSVDSGNCMLFLGIVMVLAVIS